MGALPCFLKFQYSNNSSLKLRGRRHSSSSGNPKTLRCEGLRRCNFGCSRVAIRVRCVYRFYSKLQPSKRSVFSVSVFASQSHILLTSMNAGIVIVKCPLREIQWPILIGLHYDEFRATACGMFSLYKEKVSL